MHAVEKSQDHCLAEGHLNRDQITAAATVYVIHCVLFHNPYREAERDYRTEGKAPFVFAAAFMRTL